ncbi:MAG: carboxypeptidase-like regulatory domain-containing protein [Candidatus Thermoplasmatota archaeon]|nr:carboxypeptidase-like regulatory domain-containing protein [Candidatus Thermoplasmatota archaeon]
MDDERERKLASLRGRVRSQLESQENRIDEKKTGLLQKASNKISEQSSEEPIEEPLTISLSRIEREFQRFATSNKENEKLRKVAAFCILAGAILGLVSGLMQLTGNPAELVENSQFFAIDEEVEISGIVLFEDGSEFEGVSIEIVDFSSGKSYGIEVSGDDGLFRFSDIPQRPMVMEFYNEGYEIIKITFIPDQATLHYITMIEGDDVREIGVIAESELNNVVTVGTIVGIFTILFAFLGIHAYFEIKRAKHYRRTMYFAGISMFSRGLIIVGPTLTLIGMGFLTLSKFQFEDQSLDDEINE